MEDRLWRIFENVNNWLEYAERKNAIVLLFIGTQLTLGKLFIERLDGWLLACAIALGICFLLTLASFFPKTALTWSVYFWAESTEAQSPTDNLLYFADVSKYSKAEYIGALEVYLKEDFSEQKYLEDLCGQIVANSKITMAKFNIFKATTWFVIIGQILLLVSFWSQR